MQRIKQLVYALDKIDEREAIQEEIWMLEEAMEFNEGEEYKERRFNSNHNIFQ